ARGRPLFCGRVGAAGEGPAGRRRPQPFRLEPSRSPPARRGLRILLLRRPRRRYATTAAGAVRPARRLPGPPDRRRQDPEPAAHHRHGPARGRPARGPPGAARLLSEVVATLEKVTDAQEQMDEVTKRLHHLDDELAAAGK